MCLSCFLISVTGSYFGPLFAVFSLSYYRLPGGRQDYAHRSYTHLRNGSTDYDPSQETGTKCYSSSF